MAKARIAVVICVALYVAVRLTLRYYFPPDTYVTHHWLNWQWNLS